MKAIGRLAGMPVALMVGGVSWLALASDTCDFSQYNPVRISHFEVTAVSRAKPNVPAKAKADGLFGTVQIGVLVNRQGLVVKTCPVYAHGRPIPDRSLIDAADEAARRWMFKPDFGFARQNGSGFSYVQHVLVFDFVAPMRPQKVSIPRNRYNPEDLDGFGGSSTENLVPLEDNAIVQRVEGVILSKADSRPISNALVETRGPSDDRTFTRAYTDIHGRFQLRVRLPGVYLFKVTATGFDSLFGPIVVDTFGESKAMRIELPTFR